MFVLPLLAALSWTETLCDVRLPPSITREVGPHIYYRTDSALELPCVAMGIPEPEYEWTRNGEPLEYHNNIFLAQTDGTLTIDPVTSLDDGYYQCIARNDYGSALTTVTFLERAVLAPYFDTATAIYDGVLGQPLIVPCYPTKSVPHPRVSWSLAVSRNDENPLPLTLTRRMTTDKDGNLYFAHLTEGDVRDGYMYKCYAFNPYVDLRTGGSYSAIRVESDDVVETVPTKLYSTESLRVALVGQEVRLKCFFAGHPTPRIVFVRAAGHLPLGRSSLDGYDTELVISNVLEEDEGEYICYATNAAGRSEDVIIFLDVQAAPVFSSAWQPQNYNATEGEDYVFNCKADAEPAAEIQWMINGEPIDHHSHGFRHKISNNDTALMVTNVCKTCPDGQTDLMVVQCNASNAHGYAYASGYLNVLLRTVITTAPRDVLLAQGDQEVRFRCEASSDDSTPVTITWEKNEGSRIYMGMDPRITITATQLIINLAGLTSSYILRNYVGDYFCVAENGYSYAEAKAEFKYAIPDYFTKALDDVSVSAASVGTGSTTSNYQDYETSLVDGVDFKIGLSVALPIVALCFAIYFTYLSVISLRKKWQLYVQRKGIEYMDMLNRTDSTMLTLLSDKLQSRLGGCLIDFDDLEIDTKLGKGNFGVVYKAVLKTGGDTVHVAVKTIRKLDISFLDIEEFLHEATINRRLDHLNVLKVIGVSINKRDCFVVLPFMEKGNLRDFLLDIQNHFNVGELVALGLQAARGMAYLEVENFLHRDVAARNCMVDGNGVVKIADFGLSRDLYEANYYKASTSRPLPVRWMAIECLANNAVFTIKSDVWSFGVLLWEIITRGVVPYSHVDPRHQLCHLKEGGRLEKPRLCPNSLYILMFSCWAVRPKDRPSFKDMLHYLSSLLNLHDEDEFDATDNRRHAANAFAAGVQDIELGMKETSFSSPGKRLRQATSTEDDRITHPENNDTAGQAVHRMSSSPEYLVMVESPMLQNRR